MEAPGSGSVVMDLRTRMLERLRAAALLWRHRQWLMQVHLRRHAGVGGGHQRGHRAGAAITVIGLLAYLLWLDWQLTLITFVIIPPIALGGALQPAAAPT